MCLIRHTTSFLIILCPCVTIVLELPLNCNEIGCRSYCLVYTAGGNIVVVFLFGCCFFYLCGLYLLNEGNMGSNKCTLDFVDFDNGYYVRNLYAEKNPNVVKELGDVGNDVQIYGS